MWRHFRQVFVFSRIFFDVILITIFFLAIIAGILANFLAENLSLGPLAPFAMAVPCFMVCFFVVLMTWEENCGDSVSILTSNYQLYRRPSIFTNSLIHIGKKWSKWLFSSQKWTFNLRIQDLRSKMPEHLPQIKRETCSYSYQKVVILNRGVLQKELRTTKLEQFYFSVPA